MNVRTLKVKITRVDNKYEESRNRHTWISGSQNNTGGQQHSTNRIITSSAQRNNATVAVRGAGLVVSKYGENTLAEIIRYTQYRNSNG